MTKDEHLQRADRAYANGELDIGEYALLRVIHRLSDENGRLEIDDDELKAAYVTELHGLHLSGKRR